MFKNIGVIIKNQVVQKTFAGIVGFFAGRLYPKAKEKLQNGLSSIKERIHRSKIDELPPVK